MSKKRIAFVCQRYGVEVNGGAEAECRMYAERLTDRYDVEVMTTCALDYVTWADHYQPGTEEINGVKVRRFPVDHIRDREEFDRESLKVIRKLHSDKTERRWMELQGPVSSALLDYLNTHADDYDALLFMTYVYYPTAKGILCRHPNKILIPTAHDEWPIYQRQFKKVFSSADKYIYNAPGEKRFVENLFPFTVGRKSVTVGAGVVYPKAELPDVKERFGIEGDYLCYSGRIEESKGCDKLFAYFARYQQRHDYKLKLVLTGKAVMSIPERSDILPLGFVSEEEKYAVMKGAKAFVLASEFESLSIVVLESMMMGRPVLVNGKCEVLRDHCSLSNAGFFFMNYAEFEAELDYLFEHEADYEQMCENGKKYVSDYYGWDHIIREIAGLIEA